ncbi:hypothetical protein A4G19_13900 [Pasteurellaceae bacterium Macca]|nr:hypothetical protein [Pasteurellaceae bacterium Macca]MCK3656772.1 hypothetical protein [Pasteurellaceae bacterium Macca]
MQIQMIKGADGVFAPAFEMDLPALQGFKTGEMYSVEIKRSRNPQFHRKVFAFFNFCFSHWTAEHSALQFQDERSQFETFRKHLTVLAGFYEQTWNIKGEVRIEPKSLAYGNMEQDEFEQCYSALINAALKHVFGNTTDENVISQLYSFF